MLTRVVRCGRAARIPAARALSSLGNSSAESHAAASASASTSSDAAYRSARIAELDAMLARGVSPYPTWDPPARGLVPVHEVASIGQSLTPGTVSEASVVVQGRITSRREASSRLIFLDLERDGTTVQVVLSRRRFADAEHFERAARLLKRGDIVAFAGFVGRTEHGHPSVFATDSQLLSACLHALPPRGTLKDVEARSRHRHLDLLVNPTSVHTFRTRSAIMRLIRDYMHERGILEVETPILSTMAGGANAKPFTTRLGSLDLEMSLRIAPELYLKRLVIGGIERVFELGKQFRNEGMDATHNPEFTTCEMYMAYGDCRQAMAFTEEILFHIVKRVNGDSAVVSVPRGGDLAPLSIDFTPPFAVIDIPAELARRTGASLPTDLTSADAAERLAAVCASHGVPLPGAPRTAARLYDALVGHFLEGECVQPTFLINHPLAASPLAKEHPSRAHIADRAELFVAGKELANMYSELNDPIEQRRRFVGQAAQRAQGDEEAQPADEEFCEALEYGLPPTAGWGLGVDRLIMLLTRSMHIRDVLLFPTMRPLSTTTTAAAATTTTTATTQE